MKELTFAEIFELQRRLQEQHPEWGGLPPENAHRSLLWAFEEMGEVVSIFKKKPIGELLAAGSVRSCFLEETCDVLMYLSDMMLALNVTPEELAEAYRGKFRYNMKRDWKSQDEALYTHSDLEEVL